MLLSPFTPTPRLVQNWHWFRSDARHFQILFLSTFLLYGIAELNWGENWASYVILLTTALATQFLAGFLLKVKVSPKSALITALGLCLLFKANLPWTYVLAAVAAISSKFIIRLHHKHLFNPANFGVVFPILITADGWISPGQWGSGGWLLFIFGVSGMFILHKVKRLDTCLFFLLTFGGLEFVRSVLYKGWPIDFWLHQFSSGSILLFTFFMITDPMTSPNHKRARTIWAISVGVLSFVLTEWFYVFTAPLWALFFSAPITAWLDRVVKAPQFKWLVPTKKSQPPKRFVSSFKIQTASQTTP